MMAPMEQRMATNAAADAARRHASVFAPAALASAVLFITGRVLLIIGRVAVPVTRVCNGRRASG
ncbi:MAG: hypothetical protein M3Y58_04490 [Chloroflexota bacterium]|nr:hypothetical protein [Chloroflexota bacterium]